MSCIQRRDNKALGFYVLSSLRLVFKNVLQEIKIVYLCKQQRDVRFVCACYPAHTDVFTLKGSSTVDL